MTDGTLDDTLREAMSGDYVGFFGTSDELIEALHVDTADGPRVSADGRVIAHRTDSELAERAREWGCVMEVSAGADTIRLTKEARADIGDLLDRLALLAAPAPADPEEDA